MSASSEPGEITALVVDDTVMDLRMAGALIEKFLGWRVRYAVDGAAGLAAVERDAPDVVLTDLQMPEMDGLELVRAIRRQHPSIPVVLMTAFGNEDVAIQALQAGAASYVPKKNLARDLTETLQQVVAVAAAGRRRAAAGRLSRFEAEFVLDNDPQLIPPLVAHVQEQLTRMELCDPTDGARVGVALSEVLLNAICRGNLEVGAELRQQDEDAFRRLVEERRGLLPYRDRRVRLSVKLTDAEAVFTIQDEGPGFAPSALPDPTDPMNLCRIGGRGLFLVRTFMDEVRFNPTGNHVTLVKRGSRPIGASR